MSIRIIGARLPDGTSGDLFIENGRFVDQLSGSGSLSSGSQSIDAAGLIALPGLVDLHTLLSEPWF